jgi:hypothetical protein
MATAIGTQCDANSNALATPTGEPEMKKTTVLFPAAIAVVLLTATVLASPRGDVAGKEPAMVPNRALAYALATAG